MTEDNSIQLDNEVKPRFIPVNLSHHIKSYLAPKPYPIQKNSGDDYSLREEVQGYKHELAKNQRQQAAAIGEMIDIITANPDISIGEIVDHLYKKPSFCSLPQAQKSELSACFAYYKGAHQAVEEVRRAYPDDNQLFAATFKYLPHGKVEILGEPLNLYVRCHDLRDYATLRNITSENPPQLSKDVLDEANKTGGSFIKRTFPVKVPTQEEAKEVGVYVAIENSQGKPFNKEQWSIYKHEERHALEQIISEARADNYTNLYVRNPIWAQNYLKDTGDNIHSQISVTEIFKEGNPHKRDLLLRQHFRDKRRPTLIATKDEFLAYLTNELKPDQIAALLLKPAQDGGIYDYFSTDFLSDILEQYQGMAGREYKEVLTHSISRVFITEYRELIEQGARGVTSLETAGIDQRSIIEMLTGQPFEKWSKFCNRQLEDILKTRHEQLKFRESLTENLNSVITKLARDYPDRKEDIDQILFNLKIVSSHQPDKYPQGSHLPTDFSLVGDHEISKELFVSLGVVEPSVNWSDYKTLLYQLALKNQSRQESQRLVLATALEGVFLTIDRSNRPDYISGPLNIGLLFDSQALTELNSLSLVNKEGLPKAA